MKYTLKFDAPMNLSSATEAIKYLASCKKSANNATIAKEFSQKQWSDACHLYLRNMRNQYPDDQFDVYDTIDPLGIRLTTVRWGGKYGQAACDPNDNYDRDIGIAIALCRAHYGMDCDYQKIIGLE